MDCLITKNRPQMGLERTSRFIHHIQWEYRLFCNVISGCTKWRSRPRVRGIRLRHLLVAVESIA